MTAGGHGSERGQKLVQREPLPREVNGGEPSSRAARVREPPGRRQHRHTWTQAARETESRAKPRVSPPRGSPWEEGGGPAWAAAVQSALAGLAWPEPAERKEAREGRAKFRGYAAARSSCKLPTCPGELWRVVASRWPADRGTAKKWPAHVSGKGHGPSRSRREGGALCFLPAPKVPRRYAPVVLWRRQGCRCRWQVRQGTSPAREGGEGGFCWHGGEGPGASWRGRGRGRQAARRIPCVLPAPRTAVRESGRPRGRACRPAPAVRAAPPRETEAERCRAGGTRSRSAGNWGLPRPRRNSTAAKAAPPAAKVLPGRKGWPGAGAPAKFLRAPMLSHAAPDCRPPLQLAS